MLQAGMYQNIGNINVTGVVFDSNIATGSGGGLFQNSFAGKPILEKKKGKNSCAV